MSPLDPHEELRRCRDRIEQLERQLQAQSLYQRLFDTLPNGLVVHNAQGAIIDSNRAAEQLLGLSRAQMEGRTSLDPRWRTIHEDGRPFPGEEHPAMVVLRTGQPVRDVVMGVYNPMEEAYRWLLVQAVPLHDSSTGERLVYAAFTEITDQQETLHERQQRYELVAAGANDAIWDWDVPNQRVFYSPRWKALRGYEPSEVSDHEDEWRSSIHPDDAPRVLRAIAAHFVGETEVFEEEYRVQCKDGSWKWILDRGLAQRDAAGQVVRMAGSEVDITERKERDTTLRRVTGTIDQLPLLNPTVLPLLNHELRTPLVGIIGFAQVLKQEHEAEIQEFAHHILESGERLLELITSLLDLIALHNNPYPHGTGFCDIVALMYRSLTPYLQVAQGKGVTVAVIAKHKPLRVQGDEKRLQIIIDNLLSNAVKFTQHGAIRVQVWEERGVACLAVEDTGIGMSTAFLPHMYDPFVQESMGDARVYEGGGIGLALVKECVEQLGGDIAATSTLGEGTTFLVKLPMS